VGALEPGRVAGWSRFDRRLAAVVLIGASSLTSTSLATGNYGPLLALPVTLAWLADRRRAQPAVGAWGGLVLAAKPFLGLLAVDWLLRRQGRTLIAAGMAGAACLAVGLVTFGLASTLDWVVQLREVQWTWAAMNGSLPGLVTRMLDASPYHTPLVEAPRLAATLSLMLVLLVAAISLFVARTADVDRRWALLLLACLLCSPLGWIYYGWIFAGPMWLLWKDGRLWMPGLWLAAPGLFVPMWLTAPTTHALATLTLGSVYTWTYLGLWLAVLVRRDPPV
jgi:hypothetical protein